MLCAVHDVVLCALLLQHNAHHHASRRLCTAIATTTFTYMHTCIMFGVHNNRKCETMLSSAHVNRPIRRTRNYISKLLSKCLRCLCARYVLLCWIYGMCKIGKWLLLRCCCCCYFARSCGNMQRMKKSKKMCPLAQKITLAARLQRL